MKKLVLIIIAGVLLFGATPALSQDASKKMEAMCFDDAGELYNIAPKLLMAIAKTESEFRINVSSTNSNGSTDFCHMQINTFWKKHLKENWKYLSDPCYCTKVGAWVLSHCIDRYGYTWDAVACYNTGQSTKVKNKTKRERAEQYVLRVQNALASLGGDV